MNVTSSLLTQAFSNVATNPGPNKLEVRYVSDDYATAVVNGKVYTGYSVQPQQATAIIQYVGFGSSVISLAVEEESGATGGFAMIVLVNGSVVAVSGDNYARAKISYTFNPAAPISNGWTTSANFDESSWAPWSSSACAYSTTWNSAMSTLTTGLSNYHPNVIWGPSCTSVVSPAYLRLVVNLPAPVVPTPPAQVVTPTTTTSLLSATSNYLVSTSTNPGTATTTSSTSSSATSLFTTSSPTLFTSLASLVTSSSVPSSSSSSASAIVSSLSSSSSLEKSSSSSSSSDVATPTGNSSAAAANTTGLIYGQSAYIVYAVVLLAVVLTVLGCTGCLWLLFFRTKKSMFKKVVPPPDFDNGTAMGGTPFANAYVDGSNLSRADYELIETAKAMAHSGNATENNTMSNNYSVTGMTGYSQNFDPQYNSGSNGPATMSSVASYQIASYNHSGTGYPTQSNFGPASQVQYAQLTSSQTSAAIAGNTMSSNNGYGQLPTHSSSGTAGNTIISNNGHGKLPTHTSAVTAGNTMISNNGYGQLPTQSSAGSDFQS